MENNERRTIAVIGGTGNFGGAVVESLLQNARFRVRVTTRDPTTTHAKRVQELGAELVKADSWSLQELLDALQGCWGVYLNIDSDMDNFKKEIGPPEFEMGRNVVDAAIKAGVEHFVFAGLPEASKVSNGAVPILSFDNKAAISEYMQQAGFASAVNVNGGWTLELFFHPTYVYAFGGFATREDEDGFLTLKLPPFGNEPEVVPWTAVFDDYGDTVHGVFLDPERWNGRVIWAISQGASFQEVIEAYNLVTGSTKARYVVAEDTMTARTEGKTKEVNGLVSYCHYVKGDYCNGKPIDQGPIKELKRLAHVAKGGKAEEANLQTVEGFFAKRLGKDVR